MVDGRPSVWLAGVLMLAATRSMSQENVERLERFSEPPAPFAHKGVCDG
jgi:hypothetical protein